MKNDRRHSKCKGMVAKMIIRLLAIVIVAILVGAPTVQAAVAMSCDTAVNVAPSHSVSTTHASSPAPCKAVMAGCAEMLGCGLSANLRVRVATATQVAWTAVAYWPVLGSLQGLFVKPDLGPPITI